MGESTTLVATPRSESGAAVTGVEVSWSTGAASVATVGSTGVVTAVGAGTATITATSGGRSGTAQVSVEAPVAAVAVVAPSTTLTIGDETQLTATVRDAAGAALAGRPVAWSSSSQTVATVSAAGLVRAVGAGAATISATSEGQTGSVNVTVGPLLVALDRTTGSVFVSDTLPLVATVTRQSGEVVTNRPVAWATSNASVATVTQAGLVVGVAPGAANITASVDGQSALAAVTVADPGPRIVVDAARAGEATIGPAGGTVAATSADGIDYTLTVPAGALLSATRIVLRPITSVRKLPGSGGFAAGVDFLPSGLRFAHAASLRAELRARDAGTPRLLALEYSGDGATLSPTVARDEGAAAVMPIAHFSGVVLSFGTQQEAAALVAAANVAGAQALALQLLDAANATPRNDAAILAVIRTWLTTIVVAAFNGATSDATLVTAFSELTWLQDVLLAVGLTEFDPLAHAERYPTEMQQLREAASARLRAAIQGNNVVCRNQQSLSALSNVLFWQVKAQLLEIDTPQFGLDRAGVLADLCAQVVAEEKSLPNPMEVNKPYSLDVRFGLLFRNQVVSQATPFRITIDPSASLTVTSPNGFTNAQGFYTTVVRPTAIGGVAATATACLIVDQAQGSTDVCGSTQVSANVINPPPPEEDPPGPGPNPPPGNCESHRIDTDADIAAKAAITCMDNLAISGFQNRITQVVSLPALQQITEALAVRGSMPGLSLPALANIGSGDGAALFEMAGVTTLNLGALTRAGAFTLRGAADLVSASIGTGLVTSQGLDVTSNPKLQTLTLGATTINGDLDITDNPELTSLSGIPCGLRVTGDLTIRDNPKVGNAAAQAKANCLIVSGSKNVSGNDP